MARRTDKPPSIEKVTDEARFLMRTLLREDLFGSVVSLSEAEKLLEPSLSLGFVDYCAFLKKTGYLDINRTENTVTVTEQGRLIADGLEDAGFQSEIAAHFAPRLRREDTARTPVPQAAPPPSTTSHALPRAPRSSGGQATPRSVPQAATAQRAAPATPEPAGEGVEQLTSRYERHEAIGQGGLGTVYRGRNVLLGHDMALKEVSHVFEYVSYLSREEILQRLQREVMAQAALVHPTLLAIRDLDFDRRYPLLVMDFAHGGSLKKRLQSAREGGGALPVETTVRYLLQIAYGLDYAHKQGVVHGNLKPENILFDRMGNVKVSDFGIGRVTEKGSDLNVPLYIGMGTPSYMAPEQLHGSGASSPAVDIYALGILLYEMLTGSLPGRRSPMPSAANPEVPAHLDDLFDRMTCDAVGDRFASMEEVLDHFYEAYPADAILTRGTVLLFETDPMPRAPREDTDPGAHAPAAVDVEELETDAADASPSTEGADGIV